MRRGHGLPHPEAEEGGSGLERGGRVGKGQGFFFEPGAALK